MDIVSGMITGQMPMDKFMYKVGQTRFFCIIN